MNKTNEENVSTVGSHDENMTLKEAEEHFYFFISAKVGNKWKLAKEMSVTFTMSLKPR